MNYQQWLVQATNQLSDNLALDPYLNPKSDANLLLQAVTKRTKSAIFAFAETELTETELQQLERGLARRLSGEPMAYILGEKEFWSLPLKVSPATLIPRPDTECLVENALNIALQKLTEQERVRILDLGTGTGAIALALAHELGKKASVIGVDKQADAVALACENQQRLGLNNAQFLQSDWFSALENEQFDLIVSNPPYIDEQDEHLQFGDVRFEPLSALVASCQGLADLQKISEIAPLALRLNGALLLEHGWQQGEAVRTMLQRAGFEQVQTVQDYGGNERITLGFLQTQTQEEKDDGKVE